VSVRFRSAPTSPEERGRIIGRLGRERLDSCWSDFLASLAGIEALPPTPPLVQEARATLIRSLGAESCCEDGRGDRRA
jgi:hypothetical protein